MKTPTKHVTELSAEQKAQLQERMRKAPSWRERMRAHGIVLSSRGFSIDEIASVYDVDRDTVSGWITKWEQNGFDSLADKPLSGRPPTLTSEEEELVLKLVAQEPRRIKRVAGEIERQTGKRVSADTIKRIVKSADQVWKRVRKAPAKRPDAEEVEESKQALEDLQERAEDGDLDLYYFDAAGFSLDPAVPYAWQATQRHRVLQHGQRDLPVHAGGNHRFACGHVVVRRALFAASAPDGGRDRQRADSHE